MENPLKQFSKKKIAEWLCDEDNFADPAENPSWDILPKEEKDLYIEEAAFYKKLPYEETRCSLKERVDSPELQDLPMKDWPKEILARCGY
jgi:hypothetical protein